MRQTFAWLLTGTMTITLSAFAQTKWDISHVDTSKLPPPADRKDVTFAADIKPLLDASCVRCHGQNRPKGGLRMDSLENVLKGGTDGKAVVPGESQKSLVVIAASQIDPHMAMPPRRGPGRPPAGGPPGGPGPGGSGGPPPAPGGPGGAPGDPPAAGPGGGPPPGGPGRFGPPPRPLTKDQVSLLRAWIDQGAK